MIDWIHIDSSVLWWLTALSLITFVCSLIVVRMLVVWIPTDYFDHHERHRLPWAKQHPLMRVLLLIGKNILGAAFVMLGILMLVLPGQGILTIVIGLFLLNFPRKYELERWLVTRRLIFRAINRIRVGAGHSPLVVSEHL